MNIATRLILLFFLVAVVPMGTFSYLNLQNDEETLRDEMLRKLSIIADKKALQISSYLNEQVDDVRLLGRMDSTQQALVSIAQIYRQKRVASPQYSKAESEFRKFVQGYLEEGRMYDVFLITPQGEIVYSHKHEADFATNLINGPYRDTQLATVFRQVRMTLAPTLSAYEFYAPSNNAPAAFIAAPVMAGGRFEGVIAVQFNNQRLLRVVMDATGLGETGETVLTQMDGDGIIFTAPLKSDPEAGMKRRMSLQDAKGIPALLALSGELGEGVMKDYRGVSVIAAWRYLPVLNWGMDVKIDADEAFVTIRQQRELMLEILLGLFLLTGMVAFYLGRQISEPLKELSRAADGFTRGGLSSRTDESAPGELGQFARAFNRMADSLRDVYRNLEERVEERTRELHVSNEQLQEEIIERELIEKSLLESQAQTLKASEEVKQRKEQYDHLVSNIPVGVYLLQTGAGGRFNFKYVSPRFCSMLDVIADEVYRDSSIPFGAIHPDDLPGFIELNQEAVKTGKPFSWEGRTSVHGTVRWLQIESRPEFLEDGDILWDGIATDVTDRRLAQLELLRNQEMLNEAQRLGQLGSWELDLLSGELRWSDEIYRMFELDPAQFKPSYENFLNVIHPDDRDKVNQAYTQSLQDKQPYDVLHRLLFADGRIKWVREHCSSDFDASGKPLRSVGAVQDITEQKLAEAAIQKSSSRITTLLNSVAEGIYGVDMRGNCTFVNAAGLHLLGYSDESELVGKHVHELIHHTRPDGSFYPAAECRLYRCLASRENIHVDDEVFWRKDGSSFPVDYWSRPTTLEGEEGAVITFMDISLRKQSEEVMRVAAAAFETHEGIMITDAHSKILRVNKAFQVITGYSAEDVLGRNPRILSSGKQGKEFYTEMWRVLLDEGAWSGEIWDRRKSGEIYPKWLTISAVKNEYGETTEYVAIFSDITERKRAEEEIRNLAFYDALTGLPNRRLLIDRFNLALSVSARSHHCGAVLFLDMDKFKTLNDTMGHDYGDLLLVEVARRIQTCVRETDTVARLGGDEFVVLIEEIGANMKDASQKVSLVAEKIRAILSEPYKLKDSEYHSSPSIGVAMYLGNAESVDALMKYADLAMYQAKDSGRNAVRFFDPLMQQTVESRAKIETDLRGALSKQQMQLYYQIQVDSEHRPIGAEALIRWLHPERGMVSPGVFIPVAEESALILEIGNWVIETACRQLAVWAQDEQLRHLVLAINVSAQQFRQGNFVSQLEAAIVRHGITFECLKLELTESVVLENVSDVVAKMHVLKALGIRLSLDDFGTGYSSLSYLKQLPLDQLKIDQSFVRDITTDPNDAVMVKTIIDMAKNFRLNVIAEGVETEAQLTFLKESECMAYQGYFFSKPVPVSEFEELARRLLS